MLAKAECQALNVFLNHRIRERARSHIWIRVRLFIAFQAAIGEGPV